MLNSLRSDRDRAATGSRTMSDSVGHSYRYGGLTCTADFSFVLSRRSSSVLAPFSALSGARRKHRSFLRFQDSPSVTHKDQQFLMPIPCTRLKSTAARSSSPIISRRATRPSSTSSRMRVQVTPFYRWMSVIVNQRQQLVRLSPQPTTHPQSHPTSPYSFQQPRAKYRASHL